jgi:lipoate-protein ligase A
MLPHRDTEKDADDLLKAITSVGEQADRAGDEKDLCRVLQAGFERNLGIRFNEGPLTPEEEQLKEELMAKKYGSEAWNRKGRGDEWTSGL